MGKVKIDIFSVSVGIFDFSQKCLLSSPIRFISVLSKSLNLIGCQGEKRANFRKKIFLNLVESG